MQLDAFARQRGRRASPRGVARAALAMAEVTIREDGAWETPTLGCVDEPRRGQAQLVRCLRSAWCFAEWRRLCRRRADDALLPEPSFRATAGAVAAATTGRFGVKFLTTLARTLGPSLATLLSTP